MFEKLERLLGICRNFIKIAADYIPEYKTDGSACFDIQSSGNYTFNTNDLHVVGTGMRCEERMVLIDIRSFVVRIKATDYT